MRTACGALVFCAFWTVPAWAQGWVLVEAHNVPAQCEHPVACIDDAQLALRNMLYMQIPDRQALFQFLNSVATIRGIPEDEPQPIDIRPRDMVPVLHPIPQADKFAPLINHPGVYFDSTKLDEDETTAGFSSYVREQLRAAGVNFLTEEEMEMTPGRPKLTVRFTPRLESEGCIVPFNVSMAISEETAMARNPELKISGSTWSGRAKENLANRNYTADSALKEVVDKFVVDWRAANPA